MCRQIGGVALVMALFACGSSTPAATTRAPNRADAAVAADAEVAPTERDAAAPGDSMSEEDASPQSSDASSSDRPNEDASAMSRPDASVPAADGGTGDASVEPHIDAAVAQDDAAVPSDEPVQEPIATLRDVNALSLPVEVVGAEYSSSLNRVVIIAARPNQLIVLDPETGQRSDLTLSAVPAALSLHPDGRSVAIAHDRAVSIVQLDPLRLVATIPSALDVGSLAFAADGVVYASDRMGNKSMSEIDVASRTETISRLPFGGGRKLRLHPAGDRLYASASGILTRYDLVEGALAEPLDSPYHTEYPRCGDAWFTRDGERLLNPCGTAFRTSRDRKIDLTYAGSLERGSSVRHMDDSAAARLIATVHYDPIVASSFDVERQTLRLYDDAFLNLRQTLMFPQFEVSSKLYPAMGRYVFFNADGTRLFALLQVDTPAGLKRGFAVARYTVRAQSGMLPIETASTEPVSPPPVLRSPQGVVLDFEPVDAEYSRALDRMVVLRSHPNQLLLMDTSARFDAVELALPPLSVSISRDGLRAVVGHDGWVSLVDLSARRVERILHCAAVAGDIVYVANSAFVLPAVNQWMRARILELDTGVDADTGDRDVYAGSLAKLHPAGDRLYGTETRVSAPGLMRLDLGVGFTKVSHFSARDSTCNRIWLSEDGGRLFTGCGDVLALSSTLELDLKQQTTLGVSPVALDHLATAGLLAIGYFEQPTDPSAQPRGAVQLRDAATLSVRGSATLPLVTLDGSTYSSYARFAFLNAAGTALHMLLLPSVSFGTRVDSAIALSVATGDVSGN